MKYQAQDGTVYDLDQLTVKRLKALDNLIAEMESKLIDLKLRRVALTKGKSCQH